MGILGHLDMAALAKRNRSDILDNTQLYRLFWGADKSLSTPVGMLAGRAFANVLSTEEIPARIKISDMNQDIMRVTNYISFKNSIEKQY